MTNVSLRGRLAATIALATALILIVGGVMTAFHARSTIGIEMAAARSVAQNGIARLIAELPASSHPQRDLEGLVRTFNGDRHVRLLLIDAYGQVRFQSHLAPPSIDVPAGFEQFLAPDRRSELVPLPSNAAPVVAAMLVVVPINEIAEVWSDLILNLTLLGLFVALAFGLVFLVVGHSLRPLGELVSAFHRIGKGDYAVRLEPRGPPELAALSRSCNEMAERLADVERRNRRLSEQLLRLQDEERADLARDLHDDVGPFLFAIDVDATTISGLADSGASPAPMAEILDRTTAIRQSARHARLQVRRILGSLRPGLLPGIGLKGALEHLLTDCRARHPDILFRLEVPEEAFGPEIESVLNRVVREAVNNALRHASPSTVSVSIRADRDMIAFRISDDGGGWPKDRPAGAAAPGGGYGLLGMRERVEALGGHLSVAEIAIPAGIAVRGEMPRQEIDRSEPSSRVENASSLGAEPSATSVEAT